MHHSTGIISTGAVLIQSQKKSMRFVSSFVSSCSVEVKKDVVSFLAVCLRRSFNAKVEVKVSRFESKTRMSRTIYDLKLPNK